MPDKHPLAPWLRLTLTPGLGPAAQRQLLAAFGLPECIYAAGFSAIAAVVGAPLAGKLLDHDAAAAVDLALEWLTQPGNAILTLGDAAYPASLLEIPDPPVVLYVKGDVTLLSQPSIAVVGARSATPQGEANAEAFATELSAAGLTIVSGLALGIDGAAHRGGLSGPGRTVAVIGRCRPDLSGAQCRTGPTNRRARSDHQRVRPRDWAAGPQFSPAQPPDRRPCQRRAGGRGGREERFPDHRSPGDRVRPRGFRHPGVDSFAAGTGVSPPHP